MIRCFIKQFVSSRPHDFPSSALGTTRMITPVVVFPRVMINDPMFYKIICLQQTSRFSIDRIWYFVHLFICSTYQFELHHLHFFSVYLSHFLYGIASNHIPRRTVLSIYGLLCSHSLISNSFSTDVSVLFFPSSTVSTVHADSMLFRSIQFAFDRWH